MSEHTPGPWVITPNRRRRLSTFQKTIEHGMSVTIMTGNGHRVAIVDGPSNIEKQAEFEANARLIAVCPKLLTTLKEVFLKYGKPIYQGDPYTLDPLMEKVKEVIDEAEGTP